MWAGLTGNLSANPLSDLTNETGVWALRFICITLALTPLRRLTGWNAVIRFRRMAGLFAFFYANVNPTVDHPRWSQAQERRIGEFFMRKTMLFNGYGDQVASLYSGMDLRRYY